MRQDLVCGGCEESLLGRMIALYDPIDSDTFKASGYQVMNPEGEVRSVLPLHPICFLGVFNEMMKIEVETVMEVVITDVLSFREALSI